MTLLNDEQQRELGFNIAMSILKDFLESYEPDKQANILSPKYLTWMATEITQNAAVMDADKMHRWIGFIQGVAMAINLTNLDTEMDRVRNLKQNILE